MKNSILNAVGKMRYLALLVVLVLTCGNVWGLTETITLSDFGWSNASTQSSITATTATISLAKNNAGTAPTYYISDGLRLYGVKKATTGGTISFTAKTGITISSIAFSYTVSNSGVLSIKTGSGSYDSSKKTWTGTLTAENTVAFVVTNNTDKNPQVRITEIVINYTSAGTTVTASPASITFDRVTLDPENGAEGSKNVTISLTNGNVGYPGGVPCYLNGWVETDETDCEFYVNSRYTYQKASSTTSETLSLSYYATDAGTFTGNFIIQGFNAIPEAVNCTIPLSVIVDGPACDKTITINKGTETNCSFTLSKSGAQASCSGVSTTVTVTPNTGYGMPNVTQSGASNTPTITGSGTSWTVTYPENTTGTSVINVSCSAKTTTISFDQNGGTGGQTSTKTATYGQAMPTPITTPTRTGYTFEGYYDGSGGTGNKYYNADGSSAANWNKEAATATLYAKWTANTYTVSWSVNGTNYSAGRPSTSVNHGSHVSTLPTDPDPNDYCGDVFVGWTDNEYSGNSAPTPLYKTASEFPNATGNQTFYAVFADYAN